MLQQHGILTLHNFWYFLNPTWLHQIQLEYNNIDATFSVPVSIINYVQYTKQVVILEDAANSGTFRSYLSSFRLFFLSLFFFPYFFRFFSYAQNHHFFK